ncbi:MAG: M20/M25/M40 family metallo-hydrolase [Myxococcales bacterium]
MLGWITVALVVGGLPIGARAQEVARTPEQQRLRDIYRELIEINTTESSGSCTAAAEAMAARLKAAGLPAEQMQIIAPPGQPKKGNLVARLRGTGGKKPLLLLAHVDVVEAKREDWQRDPFKLVEENGYFYARGAFDDKAMAAVLVANLARYQREGYRPARDLILALTCDEEIVPSGYDGVDFLLKNHRALIDAEFALNEGGAGFLDKDGKYVHMTIQAAEKVFQSYRLEVTNPGGHSSLPVKDNAITHLAVGLARLGAYDFPVKLTPITRGYFERLAKLVSGQQAADIRAALRTPPAPAALSRLMQDRNANAQIHTTCVATMLEAGHATNALPQRARAVVNCRILPGEPVEEVQKTLVRVLADDKIVVTPIGTATLSPPSPLVPEIVEPTEQVSAELFPGVPVLPAMLAGATDGRFLDNAGIPTYGICGMFRDPDGSGVHGLNERIRVKSLYDGQEFLYRVVKRIGGGR